MHVGMNCEPTPAVHRGRGRATRFSRDHHIVPVGMAGSGVAVLDRFFKQYFAEYFTTKEWW
jgi:hypothetical protein